MRNATTLRIFAVLIGFVLALPAAAEEQNSSTLKTEPVSTDKAASSCSSAASTLVDPTSPAFGGISGGLFTPRDTDPLASFGGHSGGFVQGGSSNEGRCESPTNDPCFGKRPNDRCAKDSYCYGVLLTTGGYNCACLYEGPRDHYPCPPGRSRYC